MVSAWETPDGDRGSDGWYRIISQADEGPKLIWEWSMVDEARPYAPLFPDHVRRRVAAALERDAGTAEWRRLRKAGQQAADHEAQRIAELQANYRSGKRQRPALLELDGGLRSERRPS